MARIPHHRSTRPRRPWRRFAACVVALGLCGLWLSGLNLRQQTAEFGTRIAAALRSGPDGLLTLRLSVDPRRIGAAAVLDRGRAPRDRWWLPAQLSALGRNYQARVLVGGAAAVPDAEGSWQIQLERGDALAGMRRFELVPARASEHLREWHARQAARALDLPSAPTGFASLRVNGGAPLLVQWRELPSDALFERLALPPGEVLVPLAADVRGRLDHAALPHYAPLLGSAANERSLAAARRLAAFEPLRGASDDEFARQIPQLLDVDRTLRWHLLREALAAARAGGAPALAASAWFFDPVSGLVTPWIDRPGAVPLDATSAIIRERLASHPAFAAQRRAAARAIASLDASWRENQPHIRDLTASLVHFAPLPWRWLRAREFGREQSLADAEMHRAIAFAQAGSAPGDDTTVAAAALDGANATAARYADDRATDADAVFAAELRRSGLRPLRRGDALVLEAGNHILLRTLTLPPHLRLRIEAGATLELGPKVSLITTRAIEAIGTRSRPIAIRALGERAWGTIGVARASETSQLAFVTVAGGSRATHDGIEFSAQLSFNSSPLVMSDSEIREARGGDGLSIRGGEFLVERSRFLDNAADGLDAEWARGSVRDSLFANNGDDGLDLASSEVSVDDSQFRQMGDKAISVGERSLAAIAGTQLIDSPIAIASKEDSRVLVRGSEIRRNGVGIALYRDKAIFGDATGVVAGGLFDENGRDFRVEPGSQLSLYDVARSDGDPAHAIGVTIGQQATVSPSPADDIR